MSLELKSFTKILIKLFNIVTFFVLFVELLGSSVSKHREMFSNVFQGD